jgi:glutamine synthetase adenylyltransferase
LWRLQQITQPKAAKTAIGRFKQISTCIGKRAIQVKDHAGFEHILASLVTPIAKSRVCAKQLVDFPYTLKRAPLIYKGLRSANEYRTHHSCRGKRHPNAI